MTIGEAVSLRITGLCEERNLTINKLSNMAGITQSTLNHVVGGQRRNPTVSTIKKVCDGLGISITEFFTHPVFHELEQELC